MKVQECKKQPHHQRSSGQSLQTESMDQTHSRFGASFPRRKDLKLWFWLMLYQACVIYDTSPLVDYSTKHDLDLILFTPYIRKPWPLKSSSSLPKRVYYIKVSWKDLQRILPVKWFKAHVAQALERKCWRLWQQAPVLILKETSNHSQCAYSVSACPALFSGFIDSFLCKWFSLCLVICLVGMTLFFPTFISYWEDSW